MRIAVPNKGRLHDPAVELLERAGLHIEGGADRKLYADTVDPDVSVLEHGRPNRTDYEHPTMKPESLLVELVQTSTREGDRILDPFMGSGTTAVAAIQNDREYVGFEVDEDNYRSVIERRIGEAKRQRDAGVNEAEADD